MPYRSRARFLAPVALVGVLLAIFLVVGNSSRNDDETPPRTTTSEQRTTARKGQRKRYTVKSGDVLTSIAEETGVPLERIQELNPDLDAGALRAGQRIRVRE